MGSEGEDNPRKQVLHNNYKLKMLVLLMHTNLLTIYVFTDPFSLLSHTRSNHLPSPLQGSTSHLLQQLNSTKAQLFASYSLIAELHHKINSTNLLVQALLIELTRERKPSDEKESEAVRSVNDVFGIAASSDELRFAILPHKLPLGYSPRMGSDEIYPSLGAGCLRFQEELAQYMTYDIGGKCPVDDVFAQKLMLKGCEPLSLRRCHHKAPLGYVEPTPFPDSLWAIPPDSSIIWDPYTCKSYQCFIDRKKFPGHFDFKDYFDLQGREKRWLYDIGLDYGIDQVLRTKPAGTIRIGLDIGGGSGTFAARMRERYITIITSAINLDGPLDLTLEVGVALLLQE